MTRSPEVTRPRVGLLAAWGRFPQLVARAMRREGYHVCCIGIRGHAEDTLRNEVDSFRWFGAGQLGAGIRYYRSRGVTRVAMAGKFHKVDLYRPRAWVRYLPDATALRTFYDHFVSHTADRKDDTLLGVVVDAFAKGGIEMAPPTDFAPELLIGEGHLAGPKLTSAKQADVEFGWNLAKAMGGLDVGQSVCVCDRAVIAVEAIEGTDRCIERAGELCRKRGFTVVKVAKPNQDMRFDVPTVGVRTLETLSRAGGAALVVEANKTILLDRDEFLRRAKALGITVVALSHAKMAVAAA